MNKCSKCGSLLESPETFDMDKILRRSAEKLERETGFGIPDNPEEVIRFDKPKIFKGELDHVEREN